jgi:hypothetical protein
MDCFRMAIGMILSAATATAWAQVQANTLSECERRKGFALLFDGTLESFRANFSEYRMNDSSQVPISPKWTVRVHRQRRH